MIRGAISEESLTSAILDCAAALGWLCYHPRPARTDKGWRTLAQGNGASGLPDLVLAHQRQGRLVFAELKSDTGRTRPEQDVWLQALHHGPAEVFVWRPDDWKSGRVEAVLRGSSP